MVAALGYFQYDHGLHKYRSSPRKVFLSEGFWKYETDLQLNSNSPESTTRSMDNP